MKIDQQTQPSWRRVLRLRLFWVILGGALLLFALTNISWRETVAALGRLGPTEIGLLVAVNGLILAVLLGRWWLIVRSLGFRIPFPLILRYGLAGFALGYFTPGPQFGGEPLQVLLLHRREGVPLTAAAASVAIDKALTLVSNFTFLLLGLLLLLSRPMLPDLAGSWTVGLVSGLLGLPALILLAWSFGRRPLFGLVGRVGRLREGTWARAGRFLIETEKEVTDFCRSQPRALLGASAVSLIGWLLLIGEYWLMARFLGLAFNLEQGLILLTLVRLAWLLPVPSALGTLEAVQIWGLTLVGLGEFQSLGVSLALLIRLRDVLSGLIGLYGVGLLRLPTWRRARGGI